MNISPVPQRTAPDATFICISQACSLGQALWGSFATAQSNSSLPINQISTFFTSHTALPNSPDHNQFLCVVNQEQSRSFNESFLQDNPHFTLLCDESAEKNARSLQQNLNKLPKHHTVYLLILETLHLVDVKSLCTCKGPMSAVHFSTCDRGYQKVHFCPHHPFRPPEHLPTVDAFYFSGAFALPAHWLQKQLPLPIALSYPKLFEKMIAELPPIPLPLQHTGRACAQPALFLDRDGIINKDLGYLNDAELVSYYDPIFSIVARAQSAGFCVIVITNQAGIAKGLITQEQLAEIHQRIASDFQKQSLAIQGFYYCPYHTEGSQAAYRAFSYLRKPFPGMILQAAHEHNIDISSSLMIGDKHSDQIQLPYLRSYTIQSAFAPSGYHFENLATFEEFFTHIHGGAS